MLVVAVSFPNYDYLFTGHTVVDGNWQALQAQANHPFTPLLADANEHAGQLGLRLTIPLIVNVLHLPIWLFLLALPLTGFVFFNILLSGIYTITGDKVTAAVCGLAFAFVYVGKSFFVDLIGYMDGYAYLLMLIACFARKNVWAGLGVFFALFIDERCFVALPFCAYLRYMRGVEVGFVLADLIKDRSVQILTSVGIVALVLRYWFAHQYGLGAAMSADKNLGLHAFRENFPVLPLTLLTGLDFWILVLPLPGIYASLRGQRLFGALYVAYCGLAVLAMLLALDVTRSVAYLFPGVLAALLTVYKYESKTVFNKFLVAGTMVAGLFPPLFAVGQVVLWMGPIFPRGIKIFWHIYQALAV